MSGSLTSGKKKQHVQRYGVFCNDKNPRMKSLKGECWGEGKRVESEVRKGTDGYFSKTFWVAML